MSIISAAIMVAINPLEQFQLARCSSACSQIHEGDIVAQNNCSSSCANPEQYPLELQSLFIQGCMTEGYTQEVCKCQLDTISRIVPLQDINNNIDQPDPEFEEYFYNLNQIAIEQCQ